MKQANPLSNTPTLPKIVTTAPVNSPSSNKSVLIVLLVVLVVVLTSLNAYLFMKLQNPPPAPIAFPTPVAQASLTPTPDETANWKTYRNEKYGFEFKYPSQFYPQASGESVTIYSANPELDKNLFYLGFLTSRGSFEDYIKNQSEFNKMSKTEVKIGSYSGYKVAGEPVPGGVSEDVYYLASDNFFIRISYGNVPIPGTFKNLFDQILSTFKFLE